MGADDTGLASTTNLLTATAVDGGTRYIINNGNTSSGGITTNSAFKSTAYYTNPSTIKFTYGALQGPKTTDDRLVAFNFQFDKPAPAPIPVISTPVVDGYKSVKYTDSDGSGSVTAGDALTYTLTYVNTGNADVTNFQITDTLPGNVIFTTGAQTVTPGTGSTATKNASYAGTGNLLVAGATLKANSTIKVTIPTVIGAGAAGTTLSNQASASGTAAAGTNPSNVRSDNVDSDSVFPPSVNSASGFGTVPSGSVTQTETSGVDATTVAVATVAPKLTLNKTIAASGRVDAADQFTIQIKNGATVTASADTSGTATTASTGANTLVSGITYTLTEIMRAGSSSALTAYK